MKKNALSDATPGRGSTGKDDISYQRGQVKKWGQGELILLVDDNAGIRNSMTLILTSHGYRTVAVSNGEEAAARYEALSKEVALVITDLDMPRLGGRALARKVRSVNPSVRILFISGTCSNETLEEAAVLEGAEFLAKPFRLNPLLDRVRKLVMESNVQKQTVSNCSIPDNSRRVDRK